MSILTKIKTKLKSGTWYPLYNTFYEKEKIDPKMVLLESRSGRGLESNIFVILQELNKKEYEDYPVILAVRKGYESGVWEKLKHYGLKIDKMVPLGSISYYRHLSRAGFLINDSTFPGRFIKKEGQVYLNVWHGTPLKCMGRDNVDERYSMGNVMRNLLMSDYLLYPNRFMEEKMTGAYMLQNLYQGEIIHDSYPRNEIFFHTEQGEKLKKELGLQGKQVTVYMPTFRGKADAVDSGSAMERVKEYLQTCDQLLRDDQVLLVKLHPFVGNALEFHSYRHIRRFPQVYDTYDILNMCDVLVTDYSSVMYDFANSGKRIILFAYDIEDYTGSRGMYEDIRQYPFPLVRTAEELVSLLDSPGDYLTREFREKYCTYETGEGVGRICRHVILGEKECRVSHMASNGLENVLIYAGDFQQNGITMSFLNLMKELDTNKYNYFISYRMNSLKDAPWRLDCLPKDANVYPIASEMNMDVFTGICQMLYLKFGIRSKRLGHAYDREWKKHFGDSDFKAVVHYNGYENYMISLIGHAPFRKIIWVHNDMEEELKEKKNPSRYVLQDAYSSYDQVAAVSRDIVRSVCRIGGRKDNITVIPNCQDYGGILLRAQEPVVFEKETLCTVSRDRLTEILDKKDIKFISIGRYSAEKRHDRLMEAFDRFWKEHKDSWLIIMGGAGNLYEETCRSAEKLSCADHIILIKTIRNPMPVLKKGNLFILSSDHEGLPVVLFEAGILGVPAIATDVSGSHCFMEDYGGVLVEPSVEGVYSGMLRFMEKVICPLTINCKENNKKSLELFYGLLKNSSN